MSLEPQLNSPDNDVIHNTSTNDIPTSVENNENADKMDIEEEENSKFQKKKRQKNSNVWKDLKEITLPDGTLKAKCIHCKTKLAILERKVTSHMSRHLKTCTQRKLHMKQQQRLNFQPSSLCEVAMVAPTLTDGKFDMAKMRKAAANWVLMHEHPFSIMEEEGFNMMQKTRNKKLLCGGKLLHVRCTAHIFNLMVQDGLSKIKHIIQDIRDSVNFLNILEARLNLFAEIVQQLQVPHRMLILDCKTKWNSTFMMLSTAIKFKDVFDKWSRVEVMK